ncbi:dihydrodipicolinate synthase family protein [Paracoccus suum]|uniref:Dihydrodipicolinate synthase family protein n=1 Tax=Paracoccus suum TaxID=2259340 RepID=A0A344PLC4_9RHOB|nr:dihydrodipicolinate synthase family protein [Paracoccus suum]AXC50179.1 dihydrodipicolinate synthase family protein [Paracoccus suum]
MLLDETARGVFVISVTPFTEDGSLDLDSTDRLVDFYREKGATGLTVLGMMGEAPKLTADESAAFVQRVLDRAGSDLPVVVGVSAPGFAAMKELSDRVMQMGAAGVMVAPPSALRTDQQLYGYFTGVADVIGADVPFVLQDFPLATSVQMSADLIIRIIRDVPSCVMLKHEDWPGLAKIDALRAAGRKDGLRRISILAGNGGMFLPEELRRGSDGAMTGFGYPEMMADVQAAHDRGDTDRAQDLFDAYLPLARYEQQPGLGLALRKAILARRGAIASAHARRPAPKLSPADMADIEFLITRQERRLKELN